MRSGIFWKIIIKILLTHNDHDSLYILNSLAVSSRSCLCVDTACDDY